MSKRGQSYRNKDVPALKPEDRRVVYLMPGETFAEVSKRETKDGWEAFDKINDHWARALLLRKFNAVVSADGRDNPLG